MLAPAQLNSAIDQVLQARPDAFLPIVQAYGPGLRAYISSRLFHLDDVDDLAQETFIAAYRGLNTFRRSDDFGAWLRGIARNKMLRFFEQTNRRVTSLERFRHEASELMGNELESAASLTRTEQLQAMLSCISKLPDRIRHVVRSLLNGGKAPALADEMNTSIPAVYQLQYRALGLLRDCMHQELRNEQ